MERTAQSECSKAYDCMASFPTDLGFSFADVFQTDEASCRAFFLQQFDPAAVQDGVDAGRIRYNALDADVCLDFEEGLSCSEFWATFHEMGPPPPPECDTAFVGTVQAGGACENGLDCVSANCDDATMTCS
jgi:hypothetical protein